MSSRRCFKVKKAVRVVSYKGGKVMRRSKVNVPLQYSFEQSSIGVAAGSSSIHHYGSESDEILDDLDPALNDNIANNSVAGSKPKAKRGKLRIKRKLKAYRDRKIRLGAAWFNIRQPLLSSFLERQALPVGQRCVISSCEQSACGRCLDCSPGHFMCDEHTKFVHAEGRTLHFPEIWKEGRYLPYKFDEAVVWDTTHNVDHGYTRDVVVINQSGQHLIKIKFCCHEPEAVTLMRNGLWPSSPKEPQGAFEIKFMEKIKYLFLECRVSLKSICQALQWVAPTLSQLYIKDIYRLLVGESFGEYRFFSHMLDSFCKKNPLLSNDVECPACPKENGNIYLSLDALFGCVRKFSAGTSCRPANHGETLFIDQDKVDSFLKTYNSKSTSKAREPCHNFQAGSNLRSKTKSKKLDETAIFGAGCRHEIPLKFFSLRRGEEIGNAVYLLKWIKQSVQNKNVAIYLFYDIACTLESHLKKTNQEDLLHNVSVAIPTFHCYGHKVSCQVTYSGRRLDGFGLSDGEVMERMWSFLRPTAKITKEMTPSHRIDAMTDFLLHYGRKSMAQLGERLCDHMKKALHTKVDAEDQLNLLVANLAETGINVDTTAIETWTKTEKDVICKRSNTEKKTQSSGSLTDVTEQYAEKLRDYYAIKRKLEETEFGSDNFAILSSKFSSLDSQLKKYENGQARWLQDNPVYRLYISKVEDSRRKDLLVMVRGRCLERWFLLQLMKKYADGQAIAKKLCGQITKTTNAIKKSVKDYEKKIDEHPHSKYPPKITFEDVTDLSSPLWNHLEDDDNLVSPVPYYVKRKAIDFKHMINRCTEEVALIKAEMTRVVDYYDAKITALHSWSEELSEEELSDSRGLLALVLFKKDRLAIFSSYLKEIFQPYLAECGEVPEEEGLFSEDLEEEKGDLPNENDNANELEEGLEEGDMLDVLLSVLNEEYGNDSDSQTSDSDEEDAQVYQL